jgi:ketosteroid isomerase-like protein
MDTYENSPELVSYPPDALEAVGFAAVKDGYVKSFAGMPGGKLELIDPHYRVAGDVVIGYGRWKMVMPGANGAAPVELTGRFTDVKAERNGKWVYLIDHASVPFAPPEPTPPPATAPAPAPTESAPAPDKG